MNIFIADLTAGEHSVAPSALPRAIAEVLDAAGANASFVATYGKPSKQDVANFNAVPNANPARWERVIAAVVLTLSGFVPLRAEIKGARHVFQALQRSTWRKITPEQVLGVFPYLLVGFRCNLSNKDRDGTNSVERIASVCDRLISGRPIHISTYLCAHKERRDIARDNLREHIEAGAASRALRFVQGLVANTGTAENSLTVHQARGNARGMLTLFPQVFLKYYSEGRLFDLQETLERHYEEMGCLLRRLSTEVLKMHICDASETYSLADALCPEFDGVDWQDIAGCAQSDPRLDDFRVLVSLATRSLERLYRFEGISPAKIQRNSEMQDAVDRFAHRMKQGLGAIALNECLFYYCWGEKCRANGEIAFGFEVDHDWFQIAAFSLGFSGSLRSTAPSLYLRSSNENRSSKAGLGNLSFRQFWR